MKVDIKDKNISIFPIHVILLSCELQVSIHPQWFS